MYNIFYYYAYSIIISKHRNCKRGHCWCILNHVGLSNTRIFITIYVSSLYLKLTISNLRILRELCVIQFAIKFAFEIHIGRAKV